MSNTILIITSNLGSDRIQEYREDQYQEMAEQVQSVLTQSFRPEFLNRIDDVVIFHRLSRKDVERIVPIQLRLVRKRLEERGIALEVSDRAITWLANRGYDPLYGARPLRRLIQTEIVDKLAMALLDPANANATNSRVDLGAEGLGVSLIA